MFPVIFLLRYFMACIMNLKKFDRPTLPGIEQLISTILDDMTN